MLENILLSIIIVTLNRKQEVVKCIKTILLQNFQNYEIIIIDNNSSDGTSEFIKKNLLI